MTQLTSNAYCFLNFHIDKCSILQNSSQKTIGLAQRYSDLYVLISHHIAYNIFPTSSLLNVSTLGNDTNLWHLRLAHLSYYVYKLISVQFPLIPYIKLLLVMFSISLNKSICLILLVAVLPFICFTWSTLIFGDPIMSYSSLAVNIF